MTALPIGVVNGNMGASAISLDLYPDPPLRLPIAYQPYRFITCLRAEVPALVNVPSNYQSRHDAGRPQRRGQ